VFHRPSYTTDCAFRLETPLEPAMLRSSLEVLHSCSEIREAFTLWLEALEARGTSPRTLANYREGVGKFVAFLEQHATTLDAVQPHHIRKWLIEKQRKGVSPNTLHNAYRNPRAFWNWCMREELTANNPFAKSGETQSACYREACPHARRGGGRFYASVRGQGVAEASR
jgi:hypothetical protein